MFWMPNDEIRLLGILAGIVRDRPAQHAVILDLSGILHIDEPVFRRTVLRRLTGERVTDPVVQSGAAGGRAVVPSPAVSLYLLSQEQVVLIIPDELLSDRRQALLVLTSTLCAHHRGTIRAEWFDLARQAEDFATAARLRIAAAVAEANPQSPPADSDLDRFLDIERTLHAVDLSSLVRETPIYRLAGEDEPTALFAELTVSIETLDTLFRTDIRRTPWLFDRVTALLDRRMLYHLLRDPGLHSLAFAVKMHAETVAGPEFSALVSRFPARRHGQLTVELPYLEWMDRRNDVLAAMAVARRFDIGVALDHVPVAALADGTLPDVDWYRVPWTDLDGHPADLAPGKLWLEQGGRDRCILTRCLTANALVSGRAAGFQLFQGRAVNDHVRQRLLDQADRRTAQTVAEADKAGEAGTEAAKVGSSEKKKEKLVRPNSKPA
jgi:hypothetical protein